MTDSSKEKLIERKISTNIGHSFNIEHGEFENFSNCSNWGELILHGLHLFTLMFEVRNSYLFL